MKIAEGLRENGIVVGNAYDKYGSSNPIERWLVNGFASALTELVDRVKPASIYEIGCGEGYWTLQWLEQGIDASGSDFSEKIIKLAREMHRVGASLPPYFRRAASTTSNRFVTAPI